MPQMNLADPHLELIDPTPNIHALFIQFDKEFFSTKLASRAVVRWSKRMYSCAGTCSYEGTGGLCDIALSEPLLKLRSRKDLVETLLHEMIHAYLFVTNRDQNRNGHGPNFQLHMHRINQAAGLNITIYHDFHDEVKLYLTHWWRCNGPCNNRRPYFGIVRRSSNRAPGPSDYWWKAHKANCGGTFIKIASPEKKNSKTKPNVGKNNKSIFTKANGDITKYIKTNVPTSNNVTSNTPANNSFTVINSPRSVPAFTGNGYSINNSKPLSDSRNVTEQVRNIWANKQIPTKMPASKITSNTNASNLNKHKADSNSSPPAKIKKIDDYFKASATLQDLYGEDYKLIKPHSSKKLVAVTNISDVKIIDCPVCNAKVNQENINQHLDECLNKDILSKLSGDTLKEQDIILANNNNIKTMNNLTKITPSGFQSSVPEKHRNNIQSSYNNTTKSNNFVTKERGDNINRENTFNEIKAEPGESLSGNPNQLIEAPSTSTAETMHTIKVQTVPIQIKTEPDTNRLESKEITEAGTSRISNEPQQKCPCCRKIFNKPVEEHLDECLAFIVNDDMLPKNGTSVPSNDNDVIVINDDNDIFDESLTFNATGTKTPCPCCMKMVEQNAMNEHLDICLGLCNE